jgi:hypothetical protein
MQYKGHEAERSVLRLEVTPVSDIAFSLHNVLLN